MNRNAIITRHNGHERQPRARAYAVEVADERGIFRCEALGADIYSEHTLREWARRVGYELVIVTWK